MRRGKRCARRTVRTFELFTHHTQGEKTMFQYMHYLFNETEIRFYIIKMYRLSELLRMTRL